MAKKIWIINQNSYLPEDGPHTRHFVISKYLAADGYEPYVFACNELHHAGKRIDTGKEDYIEREKNGVKFFYVKSHHYKKNDINRIFNITSFYFKMFSVAKCEASTKQKSFSNASTKTLCLLSPVTKASAPFFNAALNAK